jgi:hypothetical protein
LATRFTLTPQALAQSSPEVVIVVTGPALPPIPPESLTPVLLRPMMRSP